MQVQVMGQPINNEECQVQLELPWELLFLAAVREAPLLKK
jgi:hypothetical protein